MVMGTYLPHQPEISSGRESFAECEQRHFNFMPGCCWSCVTGKSQRPLQIC